MALQFTHIPTYRSSIDDKSTYMSKYVHIFFLTKYVHILTYLDLTKLNIPTVPFSD